jgi:hypothetical protein
VVSDTKGPLQAHVAAELDGSLELAAVMRNVPGDLWLGYAATAHHHAYFALQHNQLIASEGIDEHWRLRWIVHGPTDVQLVTIRPPEPMPKPVVAELQRLSREFAASWLWFDVNRDPATDAERERARAAQRAVFPVNLRARRLAETMSPEADGFFFAATDEHGARFVRLIERYWLTNALVPA